MDLDSEYDVVQKIGEGWFSRVYLTEHRATREEVALKAIRQDSLNLYEFQQTFQHDSQKFLVLQNQSVTVTPWRNGISVTITNCLCKQRCFNTKSLVWELTKVSLYPVVTVSGVTVTD